MRDRSRRAAAAETAIGAAAAMRDSHAGRWGVGTRICRTFCEDDWCAAAIGRRSKIVAATPGERPFISAALAQHAGAAQTAARGSLSGI
jgi:hypothetical protein